MILLYVGIYIVGVCILDQLFPTLLVMLVVSVIADWVGAIRSGGRIIEQRKRGG